MYLQIRRVPHGFDWTAPARLLRSADPLATVVIEPDRGRIRVDGGALSARDAIVLLDAGDIFAAELREAHGGRSCRRRDG